MGDDANAGKGDAPGRVTCPVCRGKGFDPAAIKTGHRRACSACKGRGNVPASIAEGDVQGAYGARYLEEMRDRLAERDAEVNGMRGKLRVAETKLSDAQRATGEAVALRKRAEDGLAKWRAEADQLSAERDDLLRRMASGDEIPRAQERRIRELEGVLERVRDEAQSLTKAQIAQVITGAIGEAPRED